ncbi:MAG: MG2 domain-containing protein [Rikenellaceae bacterium]
MKRSILTLAALLLSVASYATQLSQIDTLISKKMNRDALELSRDLYNRAAKDGDRSTQLLALNKGITIELALDYSAKDQLIDSLIATKSEFRGDELSVALVNSITYDLVMFLFRDVRAKEIRSEIIEETLKQRDALSALSAEPYSQFTTLKEDDEIASPNLYIALLRKYTWYSKIFGGSKLAKRLYEELISLPEMSEELQIAVQLDYIKFMRDDVAEKIKELEKKYKHCDAVVMVSAEVINREMSAERYKEEQNYERIERMCSEVKQRYPNSKHLKLINEIVADLHSRSGKIILPRQLYPNVEREVAVEVRNIEQLTVEIYRLTAEFERSETIPGIEMYNRNRIEKLDSLAKQSQLIQTHKLSLKPRLKQELKSVVPIKIKEFGRYLAVVRDGEGYILSGDVTSVSKIGATTSLTNDKLTAYVVDFNSGEPIKRASFDLYIGDEYLFTRKLESEDGRYNIVDRDDLKDNTYYKIKIDDGTGDVLSITNSNYNSRYKSSSNKYSINCYTDRGAYRPGDTIHIHTVVYSPSKELIEGLHVCNRLDFPSGKILSYDHTKTDSWGGASSSIVIPEDVKSGRYQIYAFSNSNKVYTAQKYIRIESYTQPTSEITLEPMKPIYFPSDSVELRGLVTGYDGRSMEGVEVHYEVKQELKYGYEEYETIEQSSVKTNSLGEYKIEFVASAAEYIINARMVDKNGETREVEQSLRIKERPYYLEMTTPYEMPRSLKRPLRFSRNKERDEPLLWSYTIMKDGDDKPLLSGEFKDNEPLEIPYDKLANGVYRIKWNSPQGIGDDDSRKFLIYNDTPSKNPANSDLLFVDAPQTKITAGRPLQYVVSTAESEIYAYVALTRNDSLIHSEVKRVPRGTHQYSIDYITALSQDVVLYISTVKGGKHYNKAKKLNISRPEEEIEVVIDSLPKELKASSTSQLRVKVQEQESKLGIPSKLIVTIYDKASDQIQSNKLSPLDTKVKSSGSMIRASAPFAFHHLIFDFSRGDENVQIRGMADLASFADDDPRPISVGYGTSTNKEVTGSVQTKVRDNFSGTALFSGEIITDESGEAVIPFTLSDLLTTYNVKVVAVAGDARSATTESEFVATKKVMVSTLLPQFIRVGDMLKFKTMAINRRDYPIKATIKMEYFDTRTKTIFNNGLRVVELAANSSQSIGWEITAPDYVDELGVKISLESEGDNDVEQHTLRVDTAVERVKIGTINYLDESSIACFITPNKMLQDGAFNEELTLSYEAIIPAMIRTIAAQRKTEPTTAIDFANKLYTSQATHTLAMRYKLSILESFRDQERANIPSSKRWMEYLIDMRDHSKAHKEVGLIRYRLEEFRCSDGGYSWLRGGKSSLMVSLYVARMQLGEVAIKCNSYPSNDLTKSLESIMKYLDKEMAKDSSNLNRETLEYLELRSRQIVNSEPPTPKWSSYLELIEKGWRNLNTYQMAQAALVLHRSGRDNSEIIEIIKQQAVTYPKEGVTFPSGYADNFATIVEGNIAAHTLIMTLLKSTGEDDQMVRDMFKWLMLQRKNQVWVNSASTLEVVSTMYDIITSKIFVDNSRFNINYPHGMVRSKVFTTSYLNINIVREGNPIRVAYDKNNYLRGKFPAFATLDYSYDVSLKDVTTNSSGFTVTRELLTSSYPNIGDIVRVRYTIKSDQNINLVKLRTMKCGAYEPRNLISGYQKGYYREVRSGEINYYFDLIERGTTTIEEEFMVWYVGSFVDGYAVVESIMNPHLSGNTTVERIEVE